MAHFVNSAARTSLEAKSVAELLTLRAQIEVNGLKAKAALGTVDGNRVVSQAMSKGRAVAVTAAESTYNSCRGYWKDITTILREKGAE